jgi:ABC-type transport system substrate-binding protein
MAEEARTEHRPAIREALYRKFDNALLEGRVVVPLFHEVNYRVVSRAVRNLRIRSGAPYVNYSEIGKAEVPAELRPPPRRTGGGVVYVPGGATRVTSLDPAYISSLAMGEVVPNIFETLTRVVEGARVVPWLAAEFRAEEGGARFRFRLRDDVRFHDGRRLTARDVRYSFERFLQNPECLSRSLLSAIRGARKLIAGEAGDLEGFRIHSALEFTIELESPLRLFPVMLTNPATAIVPEGSGTVDGNWREQCIGTGPFRVAAFESGARLELERNADYWREG